MFNSFFPPQYLYKMRSNGTELQQLTGPNSSNPYWKYTIQGKWSADGNDILFPLSAGIPRGISIMDSGGKDTEIIIHRGIEPNWLPDGKHIIYLNWDTTNVWDNQEQIYIANSNGDTPRKISDLKDTYFKIHGPTLSPYKKNIFLYIKVKYTL